MLDTINTWLAFAGKFFSDWPAVSSILIAVFMSWAPGVVWDNWFSPDDWKPRRVKQVSLGITMVIAATVSVACWHEFSPEDGLGLIAVISLASAFSAPLFHLLIGHALDKWVPWINLDATLKKAG